MISGKFKYGNQEITMNLGYLFANTKLADFGLDILTIFQDGNNVVPTIMLDDATMLKVWYHYVKEATGDDWETSLETLDRTPGGLSQFKKAFWDMVVGFSDPSGRGLLEQMWTEAKKRLKASVEQTSTSTSSVSSPDAE